MFLKLFQRLCTYELEESRKNNLSAFTSQAVSNKVFMKAEITHDPSVSRIIIFLFHDFEYRKEPRMSTTAFFRACAVNVRPFCWSMESTKAFELSFHIVSVQKLSINQSQLVIIQLLFQVINSTIINYKLATKSAPSTRPRYVYQLGKMKKELNMKLFYSISRYNQKTVVVGR